MGSNIGDWSPDKLMKYIQSRLLLTSATLPGALKLGKIQSTDKLTVGDQLELSDQALQYIADNLPSSSSIDIEYSIVKPPSPTDGMIWVYVDDKLSPTITWSFRYNSLSTSSYKWEFIGGFTLGSRNESGATTSSTSYVTNTNGPKINVPFDGEYQFWHGANISQDPLAGPTECRMSPGVSSSSDSDSVASGQVNEMSLAQGPKSVTLAAGNLFQMRYKSGSSSVSCSFQHVWLELLPKRVG